MFESQPSPGAVGQRPAGESRYYAPNRDLAHIGVPLLREAVSYFDAVPEDSVYAQMLAGIPADERQPQIIATAHTLANIMLHVMRDATAQEPRLAAAVTAYNAKQAVAGGAPLNELALMAVMARLGELTLGATFAGLCDTTPLDGEPPCARSLESVLEVANTLSPKAPA